MFPKSKFFFIKQTMLLKQLTMNIRTRSESWKRACLSCLQTPLNVYILEFKNYYGLEYLSQAEIIFWLRLWTNITASLMLVHNLIKVWISHIALLMFYWWQNGWKNSNPVGRTFKELKWKNTVWSSLSLTSNSLFNEFFLQTFIVSLVLIKLYYGISSKLQNSHINNKTFKIIWKKKKMT